MRSMLYRFLTKFLAASVLIGLGACPARAQVLPRVPRAADAGLMVDTSSAATIPAANDVRGHEVRADLRERDAVAVAPGTELPDRLVVGQHRRETSQLHLERAGQRGANDKIAVRRRQRLFLRGVSPFHGVPVDGACDEQKHRQDGPYHSGLRLQNDPPLWFICLRHLPTTGPRASLRGIRIVEDERMFDLGRTFDSYGNLAVSKLLLREAEEMMR